ncbi:cysteine-rich KTR domain-containing protein [Bifidobacterium pullorum]
MYRVKKIPLYCPKCKQEKLIDAKNLQVIVIHDSQERIVKHNK